MRLACAVLMLYCVSLALAQGPERTSLKILDRFEMTVDNQIKPKIPANFVASEKQWQEIWKTVNPKLEAPKVDFKKNLVLVESYDKADPNRRRVSVMRDAKGVVNVMAMSTLIGFQPSNETKFEFYVVSRDNVTGIKIFDPETRKQITMPIPGGN